MRAFRFLPAAPAAFVAAAFLAACDDTSADKGGDSGSTETDTDTDTDTDSDTDADTDADTDSDTDTDTDTDTTPPPSLYEQLGGEAGVRAVIDAFLTRVGGDAEINWFFIDTDLTALGNALHDQICAATGGGCTYTGDMATIHAGMAITDAQFDAMVGDFLGALDDTSVAYTPDTFDGGLPADTLITVIAGMRGDIVTDPKGDQVYFNQLGGYAAVNLVIDGMLDETSRNAEINWFFANTDLAVLNDRLVEQVCSATGGYCTYKGTDMVTAHAGMAITDAQFDALVGDLLETLDDLGVPYTPNTFDQHVGADDLILTLAAMRTDIVEDPAGDQVYFNQLGGQPNLVVLLDDFVYNQVANDSRINARFAGVDLRNLRDLLVEQVCEATGGFCVYSGRDMVTAHTGLNITTDEFNYLVEDLLATFDSYDVPYSADFQGGELADPLILVLAGMQTDIVGR